MKAAVVGTGLIGRAWAISFARAGHEVRLWDADASALPAALAFIQAIFPDLASNGLLDGTSPGEIESRLHAVSDLSEALADVDYVQENTPENLVVKRKVFTELDREAPTSAILASSTSVLLPSQFLDHVPGRERCLVCHPINPPYLIPAVEVVPSPWTSTDSVERAATFLRNCGQAPIVMKREIDGFIMNRLQGALLEEAFRLVADGYAGVEDIDIGLREGLALRWCFMGPFETIDLNAPGGVRDYAERYQEIYARLFPSMQRRVDWAGPVMDGVEEERAKKLRRDKLVERQIWRDRRLMALLAHKRNAARDRELRKNHMQDKKVIITCAVTGAIHTPSMSPYLPVTPEEIADAAVGAADAGAAIVHLHARDPVTGKPDQSPEAFAAFLPIVKQRTDAVINLTTGGAPYMTVKERVQPAAVFKPEVASLNMGSMNFGLFPMLKRYKEFKHEWERQALENSRDLMFKNTYADIEFVLQTCSNNGTRFEFECYDTSHLYNLAHFLDRGLVKPPLFVQSVFGILGGVGAHPEDVLHMRRTAERLFGDAYRWSVLGAGQSQMRVAAIAAAMGGNVRVGLEDSLWDGPGTLAASNAAQVSRVRKILEGLGLDIATPAEARDMLALKGGHDVGF